MLKITRLFFSTADTDVFYNRILPITHQRQLLEDAKIKIRDHLRAGIKAATVTVLGMTRAIEPRFRTQGSWKYQTCVQPSKMPPQEMDWDFGVYLPVTVWEDSGPPHAMARLYFDLVERLLAPLCKQEGWTLVPGKSTCIRVQLASWAHIDLPLYAAPENQFQQIQDRVVLEARKMGDAADVNFGEMPEQEWADLDQIVLATRSGEWKPSDPEAVSRWFLDRVAEHTEQLRRVCRYLKCWRDFHWGSGGPTSVSIMIAVAQQFEPYRGRDDIALENAAKKLSIALKSDIREAGIDNEAEDFNRLTADERVEASNQAASMAATLNKARMLSVGREPTAISLVTAEFGQRIPEKWTLIDGDGMSESVRTIAPSIVVQPVVPSTKAG